METITSLISGGLAFNTPPFTNYQANIAKSGSKFFLFTDQEAVAEGSLTLSYPYLLRLNTSVRGLVQGAPVEFRGIQVGKVEHIGLDYGIDAERLVNVVISIQPERVDANNIPSLESLNKLFAKLVTQGMRAQLKPRNILTGSLYVDLVPNDTKPSKNGMISLSKYNEYLVIPSSENQQLQLMQRLSDIAKRIEKLPFESIANNLNQSLDGTKKIVADFNKQTIVGNISKLLLNLNGSTDSLKSTILTMKNTLEQVDQVIAPDSELHYKLIQMLEDVRKASTSFEALTDELSQNPSAMLFGRKEQK